MRIHAVSVVLLSVAFLSFYVPARYERAIRFEQNGPGFLQQKAPDLTISWMPDPHHLGRVRDRATIESVIDLLSPRYGRWTEHSRSTTGEWALTFYSREHLRAVRIRFEGNFAICGSYARSLSPGTLVEIRSDLRKASEIVDIRRYEE